METQIGTLLENIRVLLAQGELEYALDAMASFCDRLSAERFSPGAADRLAQEIVLFRMQLSEITKQETFGTATSGEISARRMQLAQRILAHVQRLKRSYGSSPVDRAPPSPALGGKFQLPQANDLEKIIGRNTLKRLAWLTQGVEAGRSVCRVLTRAGMGTGFLIAPNLLMTNNHVIPDKAAAASPDTKIQFNFEEDRHGAVLPVQVYSLDPALFEFSPMDELDCTVVRVRENEGGFPLSHWGCLDLETDRSAELGEHVSIIQHPGGGVKQIAVTANQVVNIFEHRIQYVTDTMAGSSGSPVFCDAWRVIGLHHSGGDLLKNSRGDRIFANEGIAMRDIAAAPQFAKVFSELC